jgi:amino acid transporter
VEKFQQLSSSFSTGTTLSRYVSPFITQIYLTSQPAVWISIILILVLLLNCATVSIYGEAEFWFAFIKIITIVGLLIFALVIGLGGGLNQDRLGFRYWKDPGAMRTYISSDPNTGRFLSLFSVLVNAAFVFGGVEQVAVAAGEARNPTRSIPKAIDRVFYRILFFYVFGAFAIGLIVPSNSPNLLSGSSTVKSPWVIASQNAARE